MFSLPVKGEDGNRGETSGEKKSFLLAFLNAGAGAEGRKAQKRKSKFEEWT